MKFTSRKFLLTLGAVMVAVGSALSGEITWSQTVWATVTAVLGYVGIEGVRDIKAAPEGGKAKGRSIGRPFGLFVVDREGLMT